jgi:hypothetical protein
MHRGVEGNVDFEALARARTCSFLSSQKVA